MSAKYPRTSHLPFSPGGTNDDRRLESLDHFMLEPLVVTEKLDGSNLCMTHDDLFARSHAGPPSHPSFDQAKAIHAQVKWNIPHGVSIFGEWCYAVHSIEYQSLPAHFMVFGIRNDVSGIWLSWESVEAQAKLLNLNTVPVLHRFDTEIPREFQETVERIAAEPSVYGATREGVVVRFEREFLDSLFHVRCAKWVRANHVQTDDHWKHQEIRKQRLQG
jgi:hypothetical protein